MAWLVGSTDRDSFNQDIYDLITGAVAAMQTGGGQASNGAQVAGTDAWTNLDSTNHVIRTQRTESPFTGEMALYRGIPRFAARTTATVFQSTLQTQLGKPTFSGVYNGVTVRAFFAVFVSTVNSAPGNLSGTVVTYRIINADTGTTVTGPTTVSGWTGSSNTQVLAQGVSLTLTLGGSDSFVAGTDAVMWLRTYTTTHTQGIDYWPEAAKVASTLTVSNSSGGSNNYSGGGVDYTLVQEAHVFPQASSTLGFLSLHNDLGGSGSGCGIAWNAAGAPPADGANYFVPDSYTIYGAYYQTPSLISLGGNLALTGAPMDFWDPVLGNGRWVLQTTAAAKTTLNTTVSYGQLFTGTAQAGTTFINFWISVKQDKIVMVFRGDPGQSGRVVVLTIQRMSSLQTTDKLPWIFIPDGSVQATVQGGFQENWKYNYEQPYHGNPAIATTAVALARWYGPQRSGSTMRIALTGIFQVEGGITVTAGAVPNQNPNNWDLRWWIYSVYIFANLGGSNLVGTFDPAKPSGIRGRVQGIYAVASDGFTSLDELVDNSGTYLLVTPTSNWGSGASYVSIACLEE